MEKCAHAHELLHSRTTAVAGIVHARVLSRAAPGRPCLQCPVYLTERRFREETFTATLKTKSPPDRWARAGVALLLDVV